MTTLLREELGYKHLVVTDDLEMGAITRHCEIGEAARRAFFAGQDMLLICSRPDSIRRGFDSLLQDARSGALSIERLHMSLARIGDFKSLVHQPLPLDTSRFEELSEEITELNKKLNYSYGGSV